MLTGVADRVRGLAQRALAGGDLELVDVEVRGAGRSQVVAVTVDKPGGVTVDDCAEASNRISKILEAEDPVAGPYRLDVQSPGLERPLRSPEDFERALGAKVQVKREGHQPLVGSLVSANATTIVVGSDDDVVEVDLDDVVRARTLLDWGGGSRSHDKKRGKSR